MDKWKTWRKGGKYIGTAEQASGLTGAYVIISTSSSPALGQVCFRSRTISNKCISLISQKSKKREAFQIESYMVKG